MKVTRSQRTAGLEVGGDANYVLGWNVGIMLQNIKRRVELSIIDRYLSPLPVGNIFNFNRRSKCPGAVYKRKCKCFDLLLQQCRVALIYWFAVSVM